MFLGWKKKPQTGKNYLQVKLLMKDIDPEYILCNQDLHKNVDGSLVVIDQTGNNLKVQQVNKQTAVHSHTVMLLSKVMNY